VIKPFIIWLVSSIAIGAAIGIALSLGDTGHISPLGSIFIVVIAATGFGIAGGGIFAPLFVILSARLSSGIARVSMAAIAGLPSGLIGMYVADFLVVISNPIGTGSAFGVAIGSICGTALVFMRKEIKSAA